MSRPEPHLTRAPRTVAVALVLGALSAACTNTPEPFPGSSVLPGVAVSVAPLTASVAYGGQQLFVATVTGTTDTAVTWTVREASCGTITAGGLYTAPSSVATCHVVATSHADPSRTASATVTVTGPPPPVTVSVTPASTSAFACQTASFTATVTGTSNTAVTWSVLEAGGGTVSGAGVYTAPATDGTYHVVATSVVNTASSGSAAVTVTAKVLSVTVTPANPFIAPGSSVDLTATVNTTCGPVTSVTTLRAPEADPALR